jgi:hypothetical protein
VNSDGSVGTALADAGRILDRASGGLFHRRAHRARNELTTLDQKEPEEITRDWARQQRSASGG